MSVKNAREKIYNVMMGLDGVKVLPHRFGGTAYMLDRREIGHTHGNHLVDIPFPKKIRNEIVEKGEADPHHVFPKSGWISIYLNNEQDLEKAIGLLIKSYNLAIEQKGRDPVQ